jgi:uncharacterized protein YggU (UPF0235/DUF167 family)
MSVRVAVEPPVDGAANAAVVRAVAAWRALDAVQSC